MAFAIAELGGVGGLAGRRWIIILGGIASVIAGVLTYFFLIDTPALSSAWLDEDEQRYLGVRQLALKGNDIETREVEESRKWQILRPVFLDWQLYL